MKIKKSKLIIGFATFILMLGTLGSLILFGVYGDLTGSKSGHNVVLLLISLFGTLMTSALFYGIGFMIERQEESVDYLSYIYILLSNKISNDKKADTQNNVNHDINVETQTNVNKEKRFLYK